MTPAAPISRATSNERLLRAILVLEAAKQDDFDMFTWKCGTTACAVGHCAMDPWFKGQGLSIGQFRSSIIGVEPQFVDAGGWTYYGMAAAANFFGVAHSQARYLFSADEYEDPHITTAEVGRRIIELVEKRS